MNIINIVFSTVFLIIIIHCVCNNQIPLAVGLLANTIVVFIVSFSIAEEILK